MYIYEYITAMRQELLRADRLLVKAGQENNEQLAATIATDALNAIYTAGSTAQTLAHMIEQERGSEKE